MRLARRTVLPGFRELVFRAYPGLEDNPGHVRLTELLLFGGHRDEVTHEIVLSAAAGAAVLGLDQARRGHRFSLERHIAEYGRDVTPIPLSGYRYIDGRARCVTGPVFGQEIYEAAREELRRTDRTGAVYFDTGEPWTERSQRRAREDLRAEALNSLSEERCKAAANLLAYMNGQPPHRYTILLRRLTDAIRAAVLLPNPLVRDWQLALLRAIRDQPQPFYKPTDRSVRIFSLNESLLLLKREVRAALLQDLYALDLQSAQLAICGAEWEVRSALEILERGQSVWEVFYDYFRTDPDPRLKSACKRGLYALVFGAGKGRVRRAFMAEGRTEAEAAHFLLHPLVQDLYAARTRQIAKLKAAGGAENCFGQRIAPPRERGHLNWRSVLAQLAQARELQLLAPVIDLARATDQFRIMAWLHDGFYVEFQDRRRADQVSRRLIAAVQRQADSLGIPTSLVREPVLP